MQIKIKYLVKNLQKIEHKDNGDWIDLRCAKNIYLKKGEHKNIPLGVAMQFPSGFEGHLAPRSSTFKNYGILMTNSVGVVDESFCGNNDQWMFSAYATRNTMIKKNDRICQFRIMKKQPKITFIEVNKLNNPNRNGFGSTGIK